MSKRTATELEFVAKQVNDLCKKVIPNRDLNFMTFIFDDENVGYISSIKRIDAFRAITEWLERSLKGFTRADVVEMLSLYEIEMREEENEASSDG